MKRICSTCMQEKPLDNYRPNGGVCFGCQTSTHRLAQKTFYGKLKSMYRGQVTRSKARGWPSPGYTYDWLRTYCLEHDYTALHKAWVSSGYQKDLAPSIDRIDNKKYYTKGNIQLLTWTENNIKGRAETAKTFLIFTYPELTYVDRFSNFRKYGDEYGVDPRILSNILSQVGDRQSFYSTVKKRRYTISKPIGRLLKVGQQVLASDIGLNNEVGIIYKVDRQTLKIVGRYKTQTEAAASLGKTQHEATHIGAVLKNRRDTAYQYHWCFGQHYDALVARRSKVSAPLTIRGVRRYSYVGKLLGTWGNASLASKALDLNENSILKACNGHMVRYAGSLWLFEGMGYQLKDKIEKHHQAPDKPTMIIDKYSLEGEYLSTYPSMTAAAEASIVKLPALSRCVHGFNSCAGGYIWIAKGNEEELPYKIATARAAIPTKEVSQYTKVGALVTTYKDHLAAATETCIRPDGILNAARGKAVSAGGFIWIFKGDEDKVSGQVSRLTMGKGDAVIRHDGYKITRQYRGTGEAIRSIGCSKPTLLQRLRPENKDKLLDGSYWCYLKDATHLIGI